MDKLKKKRDLMKSNFDKLKDTDADLGVGYPEEVKSYIKKDLVELPSPKKAIIKKENILENIEKRRSNRVYDKEESLSLEELSYLLWTSQGVKKHIKGKATFRNVPSAGARHVYETYLIVLNVAGLKKGIYRYIPVEHGLVFENQVDNLEGKILASCQDQVFLTRSAVNFVWAANPYRCEWRYKEEAHKMMLIDVGHICQNLYLACESLDLGTCGIGMYNQKLLDNLIGVDGEDEFSVYLAPVGIKKKD